MSSSSSSSPEYSLIYWPGIPGRGEFIRILLAEAGATYSDTQAAGDVTQVLERIRDTHVGDATNPPILAPPVLIHGALVLSQLPNILLYLAERHGLAGEAGRDASTHRYHVNQLVLSALDGFCSEAHDTHHPISVRLAYEEQTTEAQRRAHDYVTHRLPRYLGYFERVLQGNDSRCGSGSSSGSGNDSSSSSFLYGSTLTSADLVLWQGIDGVQHAFPVAMTRLQQSGRFTRVFAHQDMVAARPRVRAYLESEQRQAYSNGIWRRYDELQGKEEA